MACGSWTTLRLVGLLLTEQDDEWAVGRAYLLRQLYAEAQRAGIPGRSKMRKAQLEQAVGGASDRVRGRRRRDRLGGARLDRTVQRYARFEDLRAVPR